MKKIFRVGLNGKPVYKPLIYCSLHRCYIDARGLKLKRRRCLACSHGEGVFPDDKRKT